jgi:hypothetical protein
MTTTRWMSRIVLALLVVLALAVIVSFIVSLYGMNVVSR